MGSYSLPQWPDRGNVKTKSVNIYASTLGTKCDAYKRDEVGVISSFKSKLKPYLLWESCLRLSLPTLIYVMHSTSLVKNNLPISQRHILDRSVFSTGMLSVIT